MSIMVVLNYSRRNIHHLLFPLIINHSLLKHPFDVNRVYNLFAVNENFVAGICSVVATQSTPLTSYIIQPLRWCRNLQNWTWRIWISPLMVTSLSVSEYTMNKKDICISNLTLRHSAKTIITQSIWQGWTKV